ncbi:hypothetical protein D3C86_2182490 [compost metagenome]
MRPDHLAGQDALAPPREVELLEGVHWPNHLGEHQGVPSDAFQLKVRVELLEHRDVIAHDVVAVDDGSLG